MANKHMKRCSTPLIISEMQVKTTMSITSLVRMAIINKSPSNECWRKLGGKGALVYYWGEYKLIQPPWKTVQRFLRKLGIKPPYDPAISFLGIYPEETKPEKDMQPSVHCSIIYNS